MNTSKPPIYIDSKLSTFIETLSDESTFLTGYGIYAHLSYFCIKQLFNTFTNQDLPARTFARQYLRTLI